MTTYTVHSEWDPEGAWVTTVPSVPNAVTQSKRLDLVRGDAAEVISLMTGTEVKPDDIHIEWTVPGAAGEAARLASGLRDQVEELSDSLEVASIDAVRRLRAEGHSYRDIGEMLGMSHQRAHQIATQAPVSVDALRGQLDWNA